MTKVSTPDRAGPRASRPGADYLRDVLEAMHPGAEVVLRRRPSRPVAREWAVLPTASAPRMIVPTWPRAASLAAIDTLGEGGARGIARRVARAVAGLGGLSLVPRLATEGGERDGIEATLSSMLGEPVVISMSIGRERALQKPVLRVLGASGQTIGFAKVGVSGPTRALVDNEARVLNMLAAEELAALVVPRVLLHCQWNGLALLVQEPLVSTSAANQEQVTAAALEVARVGATSAVPLVESPAWGAIVSGVLALPVSSASVQLREAVEELGERAGGTAVASSSWHGDFAPWNMGSDGSRLLVWDWEGYAGPVPVGLDLLHHHFQRSVVVQNTHPSRAAADLAAAAPRLLAPLAPSDPQLVVALYLLVLVTGLVESGDDKTRISRLDDWFGAALREQLARVGTGVS